MQRRLILDSRKFTLTLNRLCQELLENHFDFSSSVILGIQPRGIQLGRRIHQQLEALTGKKIQYGNLDVTFYRDDFRTNDKPLLPAGSDILFSVEGKKVIMVDDVLFTGRTIRAALDALNDFGRPASVELLVLIDRRFARQLPVQANYSGRQIDSPDGEKVLVEWKEIQGEDAVWITENSEIA